MKKTEDQIVDACAKNILREIAVLLLFALRTIMDSLSRNFKNN